MSTKSITLLLALSLLVEGVLVWRALRDGTGRQQRTADPGLGLSAFSALTALPVLIVPLLYTRGFSLEEYVAVGVLVALALSLVIPVAFGVAVFAVLRKPRPWLGGWEFAARLAAIPTLVLAWYGIVGVSPTV